MVENIFFNPCYPYNQWQLIKKDLALGIFSRVLMNQASYVIIVGLLSNVLLYYFEA